MFAETWDMEKKLTKTKLPIDPIELEEKVPLIGL